MAHSAGGPPDAVRRAARGPLTLVAVFALAGLAACGQGGAGSVNGTTPPGTPPGSSPSSPSGDAAEPGTGAPADATGELTISVSDGAGGTRTWTLTCGPGEEAGGDHPDPTAACAALRAAERPFAPVPRDMMCTQIYGGPETATVRGTWRGEGVQATFQRTDGCEISRWNRIAPVLQPGQPTSGAGS